jgi:hypothetical protein
MKILKSHITVAAQNSEPQSLTTLEAHNSEPPSPDAGCDTSSE